MLIKPSKYFVLKLGPSSYTVTAILLESHVLLLCRSEVTSPHVYIHCPRLLG
jgi:hypothetical protein